MARKAKPPQCTKRTWLEWADTESIRNAISENKEINNFNHVVSASKVHVAMNWQTAVALLHMVYGWMPTMLKIRNPPPKLRRKILVYLQRARDGDSLSKTDLVELKKFTNRSMVGASKLLHVLNPEIYPIWDSRVARSYLWPNVSSATFNEPSRYLGYQQAVGSWALCPEVKEKCKDLRKLNSALKKSCDTRLIELVLFHRSSRKK